MVSLCNVEVFAQETGKNCVPVHCQWQLVSGALEGRHITTVTDMQTMSIDDVGPYVPLKKVTLLVVLLLCC